MILRRLAVFIVAFAATCASAEYPDRPIRFVVPFAAGGGADALARAVADGMSKVLGQPVIVDDRPGGDATIGGIYVAKAAPDGYTILFASNTGFSGAPFLHRNVGYDPVKDFTPVSMLGMFPYFIVVNNEVPAKSLRELVEYARANPGKVNYASGNAMGIIATAQLAAAEKLQMVHVPYKGEAPAMPDLLSNRVQMIFNTGFIVPHVKEGRRARMGVGGRSGRVAAGDPGEAFERRERVAPDGEHEEAARGAGLSGEGLDARGPRRVHRLAAAIVGRGGEGGGHRAGLMHEARH
jgi:tripartite-type tricarboxylate transporter receptor subunit TctC